MLTSDPLLAVERQSIRDFVESCAALFTGCVLDYGCGTQPYRDIVGQAGGIYHPYDRVELPANVSGRNVGQAGNDYGAILCTQVIQYTPNPAGFLLELRQMLAPAGVLVITGPTNWPERESEDRWRITLSGIQCLLLEAGYEGFTARSRGTIPDTDLSLGWGAVAWA